MPLYDFRCTKCGLEFEVSRPLSKATDPAFCPMDGGTCERVFTMPGTFVKGGSSRDQGVPKPPQQQGGWSHAGHSHGPGSAGHSHGF